MTDQNLIPEFRSENDPDEVEAPDEATLAEFLAGVVYDEGLSDDGDFDEV